MGKVLMSLSFVVCLLALLLTLETFSPLREKLLPPSVTKVIAIVKRTVSTIFVSDKLFTKDELAKYDGSNGGKIYLAVLGQVFDVTKGGKHYAPKGSYEFFSGRDGSKAFVTGDFTEEGVIDDVSSFTPAEALSLDQWKDFYHKDYTYVGRVVGNFYDSEGKPTDALTKFQEKLELAYAEEKDKRELMKIFPPCNNQWT
jgi:predicted heme/steroid binding protein